MNTDDKSLETMLLSLQREGVLLHIDSVLSMAEQYITLIQEWNDYASLVSVGDAQSALAEHCIDSWTLLPWIVSRRGTVDLQYVDIGSGGGFPAIPICILLPDLQTILIERNTKKTIFLRKVTARLGLENVRIENASFEKLPMFEGATIVTSRAVEKPLELIPRVLGSLGPDDHYLCQSESIHVALGHANDDFTLTEREDPYSASNWRRNKLYIVRRAISQ